MGTPTDQAVTTTVLGDISHVYRDALGVLGVDWTASPVPHPQLVILNTDLARQLGLDPEALASDDGLAILAGNAVPEGAAPVAMAYAGHQFGAYSPRLGDGRAVLLGELTGPDGTMWDLHLKGTGRTTFARGGDGRATLGPMLREYLVAEAMHALGIPTARALAVVTTGETVHRNGPQPGAVLTRIASSHLRIGTFEYAARLEDPEVLPRLADHAIALHHPAAAEAANPYLALFEAVTDAQAALVSAWMLVGFVHGVMNTDNTTISGATIDYGPCAFVDRFDPDTVYSSIDRQGRYAFGNQPPIMQWNLARLAETLLPLIDTDRERAAGAATEILASFPHRYGRYWRAGMATKLGLAEVRDGDADLFDDLLAVMHGGRLDHTATFRALAAHLRGETHWLEPVLAGDAAFEAWRARWTLRIDADSRPRPDVARGMDQVNPVYIPRNHLVEEALTAATSGDLVPFQTLLSFVTDPYVERPGHREYAEPAPAEFDERFQTFCGT